MDSVRHPRRHHSPRHSFATVVTLALLLILLLFAACGRSTSATTSAPPGKTPSPAASAVPTTSVAAPGPQLAWHPVLYPPGVDPSHGTVSVSIAPGDGDIAYVCVAPTGPIDTMAHIYVTRDHAATWTRGADIEVGAQPPTTNHFFFLICDIAVDANNPASALIMEEWEQVASGATVGLTNFATFDFAAHWQKLAPAQPQHFIADGNQMASWQGNIYAVGTTQIPGGFDSGIWVSADQMRTWRRLPPPTGLSMTTFWLNPSSGALLVMAGGGGHHQAAAALWQRRPRRDVDGDRERPDRAGRLDRHSAAGQPALASLPRVARVGRRSVIARSSWRSAGHHLLHHRRRPDMDISAA